MVLQQCQQTDRQTIRTLITIFCILPRSESIWHFYATFHIYLRLVSSTLSFSFSVQWIFCIICIRSRFTLNTSSNSNNYQILVECALHLPSKQCVPLNSIITFHVRHSQGEMYIGHMSLSVPRRIPTLLHKPRCNLGEWQWVPSSCALLGGFAINVQVSLLWQQCRTWIVSKCSVHPLCLVSKLQCWEWSGWN